MNLDDNDVLWSSFGPAGVEGWFDTKIWDKTHDEKQAQGWSAFVLDNNGNGKRDAYTEPNQPIDPTKDHRHQRARSTATRRRPTARSGERSRACRAALVRFDPRIASARHGALRVLRGAVEQPEGVRRGLRAARHGRRQQGRRLDGAVERSARELRPPQVQGPAERPDARRDSTARKAGRCMPRRDRTTRAPSIQRAPIRSYYDFVDQFDMLGVGKDVPIATGNESEALLALVDGKFLTLRVPYPMGFFAKGMDGRIDNPNARLEGQGDLHDATRRARRSTLKAARATRASW